MTPLPSPCLLADIDGTIAHFAIDSGQGSLSHVSRLRCADFDDFSAAAAHYLGTLPKLAVRHAAIAVAGPVNGDEVKLTNYHWRFSIEAARGQLGLDTLVVVNHFTAMAMSLPRLTPADARQIGGGRARENAVIGLLGSGTGLGVSGLIPTGTGWVSLGSEGGHMSFAPRNERELVVLRHAWRDHDHVSFERLLSDNGLQLIYRALAESSGHSPAKMSAEAILAAGLRGPGSLADEALQVFCDLLGTAASDLAVTLGALGGIFIGGTVVPSMGDYFDRSGFRARFEDKGRFSDYLKGIATFVITAPHPSFIGSAQILQSELQQLDEGRSSSVIEQIRRVRDSLTRAEQRVADHVLAHPRTLLSDSITLVAQAANVSQPTVIRFCRSMGCEGLSDFKLRLASSLTGTRPVQHTQVRHNDSMSELGDKVLGNTSLAILELRETLNRQSIENAVAAMSAAQRIEFFALGQYGIVAEDAQFKFMRLGLASSAYTDPRKQILAARVMRQGDVAVVINSSGDRAELLEVLDLVRGQGCKVIAITASQSPLARKADIALLVDHQEDISTHLPMIGRILHLLMIDIMAVGVALRRTPNRPALLDANDNKAAPTRGKAQKLGAGATASGKATTLSRMTSHSR